MEDYMNKIGKNKEKSSEISYNRYFMKLTAAGHYVSPDVFSWEENSKKKENRRKI